MKYVTVGDKSELSKVVFGCMRIRDAGIEGDVLLKIVEECMDMGIDTFDHAPVYGGYTCEKIFGDSVLKKNPTLRNKMKLVTKVGIVCPGARENNIIFYDSTKKEILIEVEESLKKLRTDYIDLLLIHRPDIIGNPEESADALDTLVKEGKVLNVGVSNYMPSQMDMLQSKMKTRIVTDQMEFSVKTVENFFNGVSDYALEKNMPMMAWSPLGGGTVFAGEDEQSVRLRTVIGKIAERKDVSMDTVMYAFLFKHPMNIMAITGTMNINRIKNAVEAVDLELSYDEWYEILAASRGYDVP